MISVVTDQQRMLFTELLPSNVWQYSCLLSGRCLALNRHVTLSRGCINKDLAPGVVYLRVCYNPGYRLNLDMR